ncbi:MAG: helix-turn-helix domain-containing protein [Acholeplasmataceae bacterium]
MIYQPFIMKTIETVRENKNISQEKLVENITSLRSYYRYLNQEIEIPYDVLLALVTTLNIELSDLIIHQDNQQILDKTLGKIIRNHRLNRYAEIETFQSSLQVSLLSDQQGTLLKELTLNRLDALEKYFEASLTLHTSQIERVIEYIDSGKDFYVLLEYIIENMYDSIASSDVSSYAFYEKLLTHYTSKTNDGYIYYPLSLIQCHIYKDNEEHFQEALVRHISNHHYFNDVMSVHSYLKVMNEIFSINAEKIIIDYIKKAI